MKLIWDERQVKILKEFWPTLPARRIADMLGTTRNAIIGKAHRLNLEPKVRKNKNVETSSLSPDQFDRR